MFIAFFFAAVFLFIGVIHLLIGISAYQTGLIISGSVCTAIGLAILILCIISIIRKKIHPYLFKESNASDHERKRGEEESLLFSHVVEENGKSRASSFFLYLLFPGIFLLDGVAFLAGGILTKMTVFILIGSICLLIGLIGAYFIFSKKLRNKLIRKNGRKVWAVITEAEADEDAERDESYCTLTCEAEGRTFRFYAFSRRPKALEGTTVPVYISVKNPSKYFVDTSGIR